MHYLIELELIKKEQYIKYDGLESLVKKNAINITIGVIYDSHEYIPILKSLLIIIKLVLTCNIHTLQLVPGCPL